MARHMEREGELMEEAIIGISWTAGLDVATYLVISDYYVVI